MVMHFKHEVDPRVETTIISLQHNSSTQMRRRDSRTQTSRCLEPTVLGIGALAALAATGGDGTSLMPGEGGRLDGWP